jgi:hypothetical protein
VQRNVVNDQRGYASYLTFASPRVEAVVRFAREIRPAGHASLIALGAGGGLRIDEARHLDVGDVELVDDRRGYLPERHAEGQLAAEELPVPVSRATCNAALEFIQTRATVRVDDKAT